MLASRVEVFVTNGCSCDNMLERAMRRFMPRKCFHIASVYLCHGNRRSFSCKHALGSLWPCCAKRFVMTVIAVQIPGMPSTIKHDWLSLLPVNPSSAPQRSWFPEQVVERHKAEVIRCVCVCSKLEAETPAAAKELPEVVKALNIEMAGIAQQYLDLLENLKIRDAVAKVLQASAAGNKFLQVRVSTGIENATWLVSCHGQNKSMDGMLCMLGLVPLTVCNSELHVCVHRKRFFTWFDSAGFTVLDTAERAISNSHCSSSWTREASRSHAGTLHALHHTCNAWYAQRGPRLGHTGAAISGRCGTATHSRAPWPQTREACSAVQ